MQNKTYSCARQDIRISLYPGNELTQDDAIRKHIRLRNTTTALHKKYTYAICCNVPK